MSEQIDPKAAAKPKDSKRKKTLREDLEESIERLGRMLFPATQKMKERRKYGPAEQREIYDEDF